MKKIIVAFLILTAVGCGKNPNKEEHVEDDKIISKSICGADDRIPSYDLRVGRGLSTKLSGGGCTVTMISNNCAVSVGHCKNSLNVVEFNVPPSINGSIVHSDVDDIYTMQKGSLVYRNNGVGDDWAVFKLNPNAEHLHSAGAMQGYYGVDFSARGIRNTTIRIAGFGLDFEPERNLAQQESIGTIVSTSGANLYHNIDTMGGNSGSAIIEISKNRVIGVHSHGGCGAGANGGTLISRSPAFIEAIYSCVRNDLFRR